MFRQVVDGVPDMSGVVPVGSGVGSTSSEAGRGVRRGWRALSVVLAGVLLAAGLPLLAQPAVAAGWTPGDAWDLGSTSASVDGRLLSNQPFYTSVEAGGPPEIQTLASAQNAHDVAEVVFVQRTTRRGLDFGRMIWMALIGAAVGGGVGAIAKLAKNRASKKDKSEGDESEGQ